MVLKGKITHKSKLFAPKDLRRVKLGIMVFIKRVYDWVKETADSIVLEKKGGGMARCYFVTKDGLSVFHSYVGSPIATMLAESLVSSGIKKLVIFGEVGAIRPELKLGEIVLPMFAVREEGTSYHYLPPNVNAKPSQKLFVKIKSLLDNTNISYKEGGVWTTDAPFRETKDKVLKYSSQGVFAVEMECSALFSVAQYRRIESVALLIVTDRLSKKGWKPAFTMPKVINNERKVSKTLIRYWKELSH